MKKRIIILAMTLGLLLTGCGGESANQEETVKVVGSDTIVNISNHIGENYMKENPEKKVSITGGGSGVGIAALIKGETDIAMASRSAKEKEFELGKKNGNEFKEIVVGWDGLAVITNKTNKIKGLDKETLSKIFSGEIKNWKEVGGNDAKIVVLSRDSSSGTHSYFKDAVVRLGDKDSTKEYATNSKFMQSNNAIVQEAANDPNAIGYVGLGYLDDSVSALKIEDVAPEIATVQDKSYPLARELFWYISVDPSQEVQDFVAYTLSPAGQKVVLEEGFVNAK